MFYLSKHRRNVGSKDVVGLKFPEKTLGFHGFSSSMGQVPWWFWRPVEVKALSGISILVKPPYHSKNCLFPLLETVS